MSIKNAGSQTLTELGWTSVSGTRDWYYYSPHSSATFLHMLCDAGSDTTTVESIVLVVNGQLVGKILGYSWGVTNDTVGGGANQALLESKGIGPIVGDAFRRAIKPLI